MCYNEQEVVLVKSDELKLRRMAGQHLLCPAAGMDAACDLCGLQAQFLRNAVHALRIRTDALDVSSLVKTWTLRGTVHLIPEADLPLYIRRCGAAEDVCESGWYQWTAWRGHANSPGRERELARMTVAAIAEGIDTREALRERLRALGMTEAEEERVFNSWGGMIRELAEVGVIAFRVDMADGAHPDETKRYRLLAPFMPTAEGEARRELARRYLTHYGPVTLRDAAYFLHWTQAEAKAAFAQLPAETVECEGRTYWHIPGDEPVQGMPRAVLLAGFDPLMLGYRKEDSPFLQPEHLRGIFNLAGIVNPAILLNGRVVGKWKEAKGQVELTAFAPIDARDKRCIEQEAERLYTVRKLIWK